MARLLGRTILGERGTGFSEERGDVAFAPLALVYFTSSPGANVRGYTLSRQFYLSPHSEACRPLPARGQAYLVKTALGRSTCTPTLPSTSSVISTSPATLVSMYASSRVICFSLTRKSIICRTETRVASYRSGLNPMLM